MTTIVVLPRDEIYFLEALGIHGLDITLLLRGGSSITVQNCPIPVLIEVSRGWERNTLAKIDLRGNPWL